MLRRALRAIFILVFATALVGSLVLWFLLRVPTPERPLLPFPADKSCAIAITDDTDYFQFETTAPVYELLNRCGARVTKTVWVFDHPDEPPEKEGLSLVDPYYRSWVRAQHRYGHEITLHSATAGDDKRETTFAAYDSLRTLFGEYPRLEIFHKSNKEAFYWGADRLPNALLRSLYERKMQSRFEGSDPESPYYWVDRSREFVRYVRTYTFNEIDTWAMCPSMPYEDPATPDAPLWFASSNGRWGGDFVRLVQPPNIEKLKRTHGVSVVYVHLATGFDTPEAMAALRRCATDPEIEFVPAGEILDRLRLIQLIRDHLDRGETRWVLPTDLKPQLTNLSVEADLAEAWVSRGGAADSIMDWEIVTSAQASDSPGSPAARMNLEDWLKQVDVELVWSEENVFHQARTISRVEKWRLVAKWLRTQLTSPT